MRHSLQASRGLPRHRWAAWLFFVLLLAGFNQASAAEPSPIKGAEVKASAAKRPQLPPERKVEFVSAVLLWFAVVTVGLAMLAMVMLLGRRLRNFVRRRPPAATVPDPFWYLRKTPTNVTHSSPNERRKGDGPGAQPDGRPAS
ncbi:MAG TPA: hypothetical protein VHX68_10595 [Planctomycetaceae bacterium]|nr:hypothetical protein [Planctomycetaceae bacterium]